MNTVIVFRIVQNTPVHLKIGDEDWFLYNLDPQTGDCTIPTKADLEGDSKWYTPIYREAMHYCKEYHAQVGQN